MAIRTKSEKDLNVLVGEAKHSAALEAVANYVSSAQIWQAEFLKERHNLTDHEYKAAALKGLELSLTWGRLEDAKTIVKVMTNPEVPDTMRFTPAEVAAAAWNAYDHAMAQPIGFLGTNAELPLRLALTFNFDEVTVHAAAQKAVERMVIADQYFNRYAPEASKIAQEHLTHEEEHAAVLNAYRFVAGSAYGMDGENGNRLRILRDLETEYNITKVEKRKIEKSVYWELLNTNPEAAALLAHDYRTTLGAAHARHAGAIAIGSMLEKGKSGKALDLAKNLGLSREIVSKLDILQHTQRR